jgi:hypothetical protein
MTMIWAEGFDHYGTTPSGGRTAMLAGAWAAFSAGNGTLPFISTTQARTGTYSLRMDYNSLATAGVLARRVLGSAQIVVGCGLGMYFNGLPTVNGEHGFEFRNNANDCIAYLAIQSDGAIGLYVGSGRTLLASSDPVITASSWQHVEAKIVCDTVVGEVEVRVNGTTVLHVTDQNLGSLGATQIAFGMPDTDSGGSLVYYLDDIVTWNDLGTINNDFMGAQRVYTFFADADTAQADWTKVGDTDGFDCIDNVPPDGDTTYLVADDDGLVSEFELPTLPPETEIIVGVYIPLMGRLEDAGTGNVQASLVSGSDVSLGPDTTLTTAYTYWGGVHELDPATDAPWTKAGLEAAKLRLAKTV